MVWLLTLDWDQVRPELTVRGSLSAASAAPADAGKASAEVTAPKPEADPASQEPSEGEEGDQGPGEEVGSL